jgi:hypothetical protein
VEIKATVTGRKRIVRYIRFIQDVCFIADHFAVPMAPFQFFLTQLFVPDDFRPVSSSHNQINGLQLRFLDWDHQVEVQNTQ